jgi:hypothetical protein
VPASTRTTREKRGRLSTEHQEQVRASAISAEVQRARGYRSVATPREASRLGFSESQSRLMPALLIPIWDVYGQNSRYQLRPDKPKLDLQSGKPRKYENPPNVGVTLDINPLVLDDVLDQSTPLFITEGVKKGDALASLGLASIALYGVWSWRGTDESGRVTALADWEQIPLKRRDAYVAFDSDVMQKRSVEMSLERIGNLLGRRGAKVQYIYLPPGEHGAKQGVDDFLAAGNGIDELLELAEEHIRGLPEIVVNGRQLRESGEAVLQALVQANDPPQVFEWANNLARIRIDGEGRPVIQAHNVSTVRNRMSAVADFYKSRGDKLIAVSPPKELAENLLAEAEWSFPVLHAITRVPVLRADGTVLGEPGYDEDTRLAFIPSEDLQLRRIPPEPTRDQAVEALAWLKRELLPNFPFADGDLSRANMIASLLTPVLRDAIDGPVPLALVDAPQAGTGKSLLAELQSAIVLGRPAEMRGAPSSEEEWRKQITSALMEGPSMVIFDNVMGKLSSGELSRALTAQIWTDRVLGVSKDVALQVRTAWMATGNNIILGGDLPRRAYLIRIDARMARPWKRGPETFRHPELIQWTMKNRGKVNAALLGMGRAWFAADCPKAGVPILGTFESWSRVIGGVLAYAGDDSFLQNAEQLYDEMDIETEQWGPFLMRWFERFGSDTVSGGEVYDAVKESGSILAGHLPDELTEALAKGQGSFSRVLGHNLRYRRNRHFQVDDREYFLDRVRDKKRKVYRWRVVAR